MYPGGASVVFSSQQLPGTLTYWPTPFWTGANLLKQNRLHYSQPQNGYCKGLVFRGNSLLNSGAGLNVSGHAGGINLLACGNLSGRLASTEGKKSQD